MKAYKALAKKRNGRKLYSYNINLRTFSLGDFNLIYSKTGKNYPKVKGTKLFVFGNLEDAKQITNDYSEIWLVEVDKLIRPKAVRVDLPTDKKELKRCWKRGNLCEPKVFAMSIPSGTRLCNWIKLIKRVDAR
jgi:hypothetical protein